MKTAIYIEDGVVQLVITPETEFERGALATIRNKPLDTKVISGSFYDCRGGWVRQSAYYPSNPDSTDKSLILVHREEQDQDYAPPQE